MRIRGREHGFTLVELLAVVGLLALLSVFAAPKALSAFNKGAEAGVAADLRIIQDALERHYTDLGYYPNKLGDLIKRGYLRSSARLKSPVSRKWYFYAIDDNRTGWRAQAFALGDPGKEDVRDFQLRRGGPLPRGRNPFTQRAWAWYTYNSYGLLLFAENDQDSLPVAETPRTLATYRYACRTNAPVTCDLRTN